METGTLQERDGRELVRVVVHKPPTSQGPRFVTLSVRATPTTTVKEVKRMMHRERDDLAPERVTCCVEGTELQDNDPIAPNGLFQRHPRNGQIFLQFRYDDPTLEEVVRELRARGDLLIPLHQVTIKEK